MSEPIDNKFFCDALARPPALSVLAPYGGEMRAVF